MGKKEGKRSLSVWEMSCWNPPLEPAGVAASVGSLNKPEKKEGKKLQKVPYSMWQFL